ncbi:MAG: phenylalanine--tRNA ligase subunit beta [Rubrobacter sp.]|nr:phenylalanine--tRNA ligase subunit beta [Rubrobacter sp.]
MRVPLSWLHEYVDFDLSTSELVELFSLRSQEVDGIERLGVVDGEVVVGEVVEFGPHPNADRLNVAKVDLGGREVQIVAGAPNPYPGARVPVVLPGSTLADGRKLKKAKLRGLESYGMMMSERELGISGEHTGILLLDGSYEIGRPLADYFPAGETILELDVNPNRPDLWGMIGVARELAAILKTSFRVPESNFSASGAPTADYTLRVEAGDLCPRYDLRRVSGVRPGERAPLEMRRRIHAAGMRPINAIVDATNYVMLETGQPIHAFDAAKVRGGIVARRARPGEEMTMLDGHTRTLDEEMLVISDEERGLVVAGVMGAEDAEVSDETSDVLVEVATFVGTNILATSQRLALRTDASGRYERGLDPEMVDYAMSRVCGLIAAEAGGTVAGDTLIHYPEPVQPRTISMRHSRTELLLGMRVEQEEAAERLRLLGCEVWSENGRIEATVPTFRRDLSREADLIEEVGRLIGLENIPERLPGVPLLGGLTQDQRKLRLLRHLLADLGLTETVTYPFGPDRWRDDLGFDAESGEGLRLRNPLSAEAANLRETVLTGLLDATARNRAFGSRGVALFEVGRIFESVEADAEMRPGIIDYRMNGEAVRDQSIIPEALMGVREENRVGVLLAGNTRSAGWNAQATSADFFQAKGIVERLVPGAIFEPRVRPFLHPGRAAAVLVGGMEAGWVGEIHPSVAEKFDLEGWPLAAFELNFALCEPDSQSGFEPFANVPAVTRDLAVVVSRATRVGDLTSTLQNAESTLLTELRVFDVYEGPQVPEDMKSVAFSLIFQASETLTDEEVNAEFQRLAERLRKEFDAEIRST